MIGINIVCVGGLKEKYFIEAAAEYEKRLTAYCKLKNSELKTEAGVTELLAALPQRYYKVALCVEGEQQTSEQLAELIERRSSTYPGIAFVIGGSDGLPERVKEQCDLRLSFSKMTFPHKLMRVILLEQVYRAFTIINGQKYHK